MWYGRVERVYILLHIYRCTIIVQLHKNRLTEILEENIYVVGRVLKWSPMTHAVGRIYENDRISFLWLYDKGIFCRCN